MNEEEIQIIDFAYLKMCAEHDYIYETGEAKLLLNYITNLQQENAQLKDKIENATKLIEEIKLHYQQLPTMIPNVKINKLEDLLKEN